MKPTKRYTDRLADPPSSPGTGFTRCAWRSPSSGSALADLGSWRQGVSLDVREWLTPKDGRTPAVIVSVAHLDDEELTLVLGVRLEAILVHTRRPQARPAEHPAAPEAEAPLVRRLHALATAWNDEAAPQRINDWLAVHLAEDNGSWSGTSSRWPMVVAYHPKGADQRESLHVSFTTLPSLTLADLQGQFGPPAHQIKSKESLVDFNGPSGVRVVVGLLGGLTPESAVSWIRLEEPGRRKPPRKDLF